VDDRDVSGGEQASREELLVLIAAQARMLEVAQQRLAEQAVLIEQQAARIEEQAARIAELERKVGRNSRNSSSPPAADGLDKPPVRSVRTKGTRRAGKQPGAPAATLSQVAKPDVVIEHFPAACGCCAGPLARERVVGEVVRRQVFDLPEVKVKVTEHQLFALVCDECGRATRAEAPGEAAAPACYGPTVTAMVAYLSAQHHIPFDRVAEIMAEVAGVDLSAGFVVAACRRVQDAVEPVTTAVKDAIAAAPVAHFDESVTRVAGANHWMHTAATATLTAYHINVT
jgi:transposase